MAETEFKVVVNDVKTGKSYNVSVTGNHTKSLLNKKLGEVVDGNFLNLPGYKLMITGGSDATGSPMRKDLPGNKKRNLLVSDSLGFHEIYRGERRRVGLRGNTISAEIVQVNMKITEYGPKSIEDSFAATEAPSE